MGVDRSLLIRLKDWIVFDWPRAGEVGRLAISVAGIPYITPVNFSVIDGNVVVQMGTGLFAFHLDADRVAFEVDHVDAGARSGWSVVVRGTARILAYQDVARLEHLLPRPLVAAPGTRVFAIYPEAITGRVITLGTEPSETVEVSRSRSTRP